MKTNSTFIDKTNFQIDSPLSGGATDTSGNGNDGTATSISWLNNYTGKLYAGQYANFVSSSSSNISYGNIGNVKAISFWINLATTTENILEESSGTGVSVSSGTLSYGSWDNAFVNLTDTDTITTGRKHIVLTSTTDVSLSAFKLGVITSTYGDFDMSSLKVSTTEFTEAERETFYKEGLRQFGPTNLLQYGPLFEDCVACFEVGDGTTQLNDFIGGVVATRTAGTNTTDELGKDKALTNPNYSWTSITYTTGYTYEDSGSGRTIETSPTGLSATGVNRTTDLRYVMLFNKTLSTAEKDELTALFGTKYIYPFSKYSLPNLRENLVLEITKPAVSSTYYDSSGNGNDGTNNGVADTQLGLHNIMTFVATSSDRIDLDAVSTDLKITNEFSYALKFKTTQSDTTLRTFLAVGWSGAGGILSGYGAFKFNGKLRTYFNESSTKRSVLESPDTYSDGEWHHLVVTKSSAGIKIYMDTEDITSDCTELVDSSGQTATVHYAYNNADIGSREDRDTGTQQGFYDGDMADLSVWDKVLTAGEVQQDRYSKYI